jgi:rod shape-determining protein MreC
MSAGLGIVAAYWLAASSGVLDRYASYCLYPVLLMQRSITGPINTMLSTKQTQRELEVTLNRVRLEKEALAAQLIELRAATAYLDEIQEVLEFKARYGDQDGRLAHVLMRAISPQEHFFLVGAGSEHGIEKDMIAVYKNGLVGRVTEVYPWYSKLLLITDRSCKIAAQCCTTGAVGIHEGLNDVGESALTRVSHLAAVEKGDLIVSTGDGLVFPKGFALGSIASSEADGLFHRIVIAPVFDVSTIEYCYLIRKTD